MGIEIIIGQIIVALLVLYLTYYAQQKGKNQADKQDLQKLTEIVEGVKKKNNEELELVKANFSLLSNRHLQIFNEEKDAIIRFYAYLNKWLWDSLNIYFNEFNITNYADLTTRIVAMRDAYNEVNVAFSKVNLLVTDAKLTEVGRETIIETLKLHQFKEGLASKLRSILSWDKAIIDQFTSGKINFLQISNHMKEFYLSQERENKEEREKIMTEFFEKNSELFSAAIEKVYQFQEIAKSYLRK